ncbi:MAG: MarR family transcriptional regulator [Candidatus Nitrosocosmicus sp.]|nr:MarR family transcriptional regulator [Candidatus Nitrosocosmicus sp.]MDN5868852.1 MarR family transcriptional regulator [Candidatus Nitrosocosmicus sp.]
MPSDNGFSQSPNHFMVLDAISMGVNKLDSITKRTNLSKDEVELIVNDLQTQKLITKQTKKGFFGNKKIEVYVTETGFKILESKKQELVNKSKYLQQLYETGNRGQMQSYMNKNRSWMPMMLFSGLINMVMFTSMMSFMGMPMNPSENAQGEAQAAESGGSGAEDSGAASDTGDTGDYSDMDMGGMDTGGFDSF